MTISVFGKTVKLERLLMYSRHRKREINMCVCVCVCAQVVCRLKEGMDVHQFLYISFACMVIEDKYIFYICSNVNGELVIREMEWLVEVIFSLIFSVLLPFFFFLIVFID